MVFVAFVAFMDDLGCVGSVQGAGPTGSRKVGACRQAMGMVGRLPRHDHKTRPRDQRGRWPWGLLNEEEIRLPMVE
jgi:hypothetical protein